MTITQDDRAPLVVVVGSTGIQGGPEKHHQSVIRNLAASDRNYRIRALTRNHSSEKAQELAAAGCQVHTVNLVVGNQTNVYKAFEDADYAHVTTQFWEHIDHIREEAEGKMMIDAAKKANVKLLTWSGLPDITEMSGGKLTHVVHFDGKKRVSDYALANGPPTVIVMAGWYASNALGSSFGNSAFGGFKKQADNTFLFDPYFDINSPLPLIDMEHDYGLFVRAAIENPNIRPGMELYTCGEMITPKQMADQFTQVTGKPVRLVQIPGEELVGQMEKFTGHTYPELVKLDLIEVGIYCRDYGYYGPNKDPLSIHKHLARSPRSWKDYVLSRITDL